jgi:methyl-accepting chemotaxis protein
LRGAVGGDLKSQAVDDILNSFDLGGMGYAFLVDDQGSVLVHPDKSLVLKKLADLYPGSTPRLESDLQNAVAVDGSARIVTFLPVQGLAGGRWYVGLSVDESKAFAALRETRLCALMATIIGVVTILLLLGVLNRILLRPLHVMSHAMSGIADGEGDLTQRLNMDITEINTLNQDGVRNLQASLSACTEQDQQVGRLKQLVGSFRI